MLNNKNNNHKCGSADEIVSYIYDEINVADRRVFEAHLANCSMCTDEFAAVSNARFSVFEWQKEEFAPLSTPEIIIPYAVRQETSDATVSTGVFSGLREFFALLGRPMIAVAALALCVGLGFFAMTYLGDGKDQTAAVPEAVPPGDLAAAPEVPLSSYEPTPEPAVAKTAGPRPLKAIDKQPRTTNRQVAVDRRKPQNAAAEKMAQRAPKPVLSNYDDSDDKSLRLADLFEEVGGGI